MSEVLCTFELSHKCCDNSSSADKDCLFHINQIFATPSIAAERVTAAREVGKPYGLPIKGYWQTVTVCQLEIIGRLFTKYVNVLPFYYCWQVPEALYKIATITALFKRLQQRISAKIYFLNGLPMISNWQTVTVCQ